VYSNADDGSDAISSQLSTKSTTMITRQQAHSHEILQLQTRAPRAAQKQQILMSKKAHVSFWTRALSPSKRSLDAFASI
jgi:hypothetical protein